MEVRRGDKSLQLNSRQTVVLFQKNCLSRRWGNYPQTVNQPYTVYLTRKSDLQGVNNLRKHQKYCTNN